MVRTSEANNTEMQELASARLYGHGAPQAFFTECINSGTLGHAYLFFGDRGIGKCTFAHAIATRLETGSLNASHPPLVDLCTICPDEKGTIGIDAAREVRKFVSQTPSHSSRRTVVIDASVPLTDEAQGALLKVVEEPPHSALIICVVHDPALLTSALRSRFAQVYFARFSRDAVADYLVHYCGVTAARARECADRSFGSIGYARSLAGIAVTEYESKLTLARTLATDAVALYHKDVRKHASAIRFLINRITLLEELNLNEVLQARAVEASMKSSVY